MSNAGNSTPVTEIDTDTEAGIGTDVGTDVGTNAGLDSAGARLHFLFLNLGHFLDHLFMLIFSTVAALVLVHQWGLGYSQLIPYATPGFIAFAAFTIPAGWLADRFGREVLMTVFFIGIGAASIVCSAANSPLQIAVGLFLVGVFASIYHPVGIALVLEGQKKTGMRVASNGVWGNLGVAVAALLTGALIDIAGWRVAFVVPGVVSVVLGVLYHTRVKHYSPGLQLQQEPKDQAVSQQLANSKKANNASAAEAIDGPPAPGGTNDLAADRKTLIRLLAIVLLTTACGGIVFQSTTFALPKVLLERTGDLASTATWLGWIAFAVFAIGSIGQLVVGYLLDRQSPRRVFTGVAVLQVVFFALTMNAHGPWVPVLAAGFMLAAFGQIPINDVLVGRYVGRAFRSRALAIRYTVTLSTMALSVPLIAWLHATGGVTSLFQLLTAVAVVITIGTLLLPRFVDTVNP